MNSDTISPESFERPTLEVARWLLGIEIAFGGCAGIIVETEAYTDDPASHWVTRPRTGRLLGESHGLIYIYNIYGVHRCLNFTTDVQAPGAVLIRALEPTTGLGEMQQRRGKDDLLALASGPAKLVEAMAINSSLNGKPVMSHFALRRIRQYGDREVGQSARIGVSRGKSLPWRFFVKNCSFASRT